MKKLLLSAFALAVALSASAFNLAPSQAMAMNVANLDVKKAPAELTQMRVQKKLAELAKTKNANQFNIANPTKPSELMAGFSWTYAVSSDIHEDPDSVASETAAQDVVFYGANDTDNTIKVAGMFQTPVTFKLDYETYSQYGTALVLSIDEQQIVGYSNTYGELYVGGLFYYEGGTVNGTTYEAGFYLDDITAVVYQGDILFLNDWITYFIKSGQYAGYNLATYYLPYSSMTDKPEVNAVMETPDANLGTVASVMASTEDENYIATFTNFEGFENTVHFNLAADKTWKADMDVIYNDTTNNRSYALVGLAADTTVIDLVGTGTETSLTFGSAWSGIDVNGSGYWMGWNEPSTIFLVGGEFTYPEATPEPTPDVYILGEVGENTWAPNVGLKMQYSEENQNYTANVTFDGRGQNGENYFSFTTKLADNADDWDGIAQYRFGAVSEATDENPNGDFYVTDEMLGIDLSLTNEYVHAFRVAKGEYNLTLNYADMKLKIEKVAPTVKLGDVNGDGDVNVNDVTVLINYILGKNPTPFIEANANVNGDEGINVNDVTALINMILN